MTSRFGISSFTLKVAAIAGMTCNHVANIFAGTLPGWFTVLLCTFGGLTFPIMAFLLCEGYRYTSNVRRYAARLAAFAAVAQIPYSLLWGATANVLVTLLIGLGILWAQDHLRNRIAFAAVLVAGVAGSVLCDWGVIGPVMIYLFHQLRENPRGVILTMLVAVLSLGLPVASNLVGDLQTAAAPAGAGELTVESPWEALCEVPARAAESFDATTANTVYQAGALMGDLGAASYYTIGFALATALMLAYNGQRGRPMKWFFYVYYPAHLLVLWALAHLL